LVARIHAWFHLLVERALGFGVFGDGFDDHIGMTDAIAIQIGGQAVKSGSRLARVFFLAREQLAGPALGGGDALAVLVLKRDCHALQRAPCGDISAHYARADDMDVSCRRRARFLAAKTLQALLQAKDSQQIARGVRADDRVDKRRRLKRIAIVMGPYVQYGARCGVVAARVALV
jgi:hypothetical protein